MRREAAGPVGGASVPTQGASLAAGSGPVPALNPAISSRPWRGKRGDGSPAVSLQPSPPDHDAHPWGSWGSIGTPRSAFQGFRAPPASRSPAPRTRAAHPPRGLHPGFRAPQRPSSPDLGSQGSSVTPDPRLTGSASPGHVAPAPASPWPRSWRGRPSPGSPGNWPAGRRRSMRLVQFPGDRARLRLSRGRAGGLENAATDVLDLGPWVLQRLQPAVWVPEPRAATPRLPRRGHATQLPLDNPI